MRSALLALAAFALAFDARAQDEETAHHGFEAQVLQAPVIVPGPNGPHLVHELHLTNFADATLALWRIEVTFQDGGSTFATYEGDELERALGGPAPRAAGASRLVMAPGARAILYVRAPTNGIYEPPTIAHRIFYRRDVDGVTHDIVVSTPELAVVGEAQAPVLGPPLRGGPWVAVYGPDWERGHRRVVYAIDGRARIPGRFAIDFMRVGGGGVGAEVLAVADGVVAAVRDDFPKTNDAPRTLGNAAGNYVSIDIGGGRYAIYEHLLQDGRVRLGDRVRRGEVIGELGETGATTQAHLHFHVADGPYPLSGEGLPYALQYTPLGIYETIEQMNAGGPWEVNGGTITPSLPAPMMVVRFPD